MTRKKRIIVITCASVATVAAVFLLAVIVACGIYLGTYYHAQDDEIEAFLNNDEIKIEEIDKNTVAFVPADPKAGFIFYPGGKVEVDAYYPLMAECAKYGILSVAVEMPFNLAVFNINGANGIREEYPEITSWYIGGHSLGGSMAASYLGKNKESFDGIILLGSYSTVDFSDSDLNAISIFGENDGVMNREKYEEYKSNLPSDFSEIVIDGGNYAGFGMYGAQKGDGVAEISPSDQIKTTATIISDFIGMNMNK